MKMIKSRYPNTRDPMSGCRTITCLGVLPLLMIAACVTVGQDYVPPTPNAPDAWHTEIKSGLSKGEIDNETLAEWWKNLDDPVLSLLINQAALDNLDVKKALARLREARARAGISKAGQFPTLDASADVTRSRGNSNISGGAIRELYSAAFDAGWEIDIFGGKKRSVEASHADMEATESNLHDVLVSLLAEVALSYVEVRTYQTQLTLSTKNLSIQEETYQLVDVRSQAGLSDELTLQQARYNLENTRSQLPTLRIALENAKNRLAVLLGKPPGSLPSQLEAHGEIPVAPLSIAVGVPADMLRRRPDIQKAERELAAQAARIGVATAELYPKLKLIGSIGLESLKSAELFTSASRVWKIGSALSWNIFDAGAIRKNIEVQFALQEQYLVVYEAAVLGALEEVDNALVAYAEEQLRSERLIEAVDAAQIAEQLSRNLYKAGLTDFNKVLDAQRSLLSFQDQLAESDGAVTSNLIRLYKALGGGWASFDSALSTLDENKKDIRR